MIKQIIKSILPETIKDKLVIIRNNFFCNHYMKSYSQEGEDMILRRLFEKQKRGFFIDIGAHHPKRFSNTYFFYRKGWNGINIDAMPGSMRLFNRKRARDINIEKPISDKGQLLTYYAFSEPALNGFSKEVSERREKQENIKLLFKKEMESVTLERVLDDNLINGQRIDFMSIDVEGLDLNVLKSTNFKKHQPSIILIEILKSSMGEIENSEISKYLSKYDYFIFAKTINTVFFSKKKFFNKRFKNNQN